METCRADQAAPRDPIDVAWESLTLLVPAIVSLLSKMGAIDLAYHIRAGEDVLHGNVPRVDTWTFTFPGTAWLDQQWLAQAIFAALHGFGEWPLLLAAQAVLVGVSTWLVYLACRATGARTRTASLLALGGFLVATPALGMRPQLLAVPLFATLLWITAGRRAHPGRLWFAPLLAAVCANVHGSFVLFPVVVWLAWLEDLRRPDPGARRTLLIAACTAVATIVTPFGPRVWLYVYDVSTNPVIRTTITEWAPLTLSTVPGWLAIGSALAIVGYLSRRGRPTRWTALLTLGIFFLLALSAQRAIVWWAMVAPVVVAAALAEANTERRPKLETSTARLPAYVIVGTLVAALVVLAPWWRGDSYDRFLTAAPPGLTQAATDHLAPGTRTLVFQPWASWFEYALPNVPVFVDSRIEIVPNDVWHDYGQIAFSGADWKDTLARYNVQAIVASADWDILPMLRADPGWRQIYSDDDGALFVRA